MKNDYSITALCQALEVSASGYRDWEQRKNSPAPRALEEQKLRTDIVRIHQDSRQTYGAPRVQVCLRYQGRRHGRNRIARLMREQGLFGRQKKRYRMVTTDSHHEQPIAPNRLSHLPAASRSNQILAAALRRRCLAQSMQLATNSITVVSTT